MSGRKNAILKYQNITSGNMAGDITSTVSSIEFVDNVGIQLNYTGTPVGDFFVQVSCDYAQDSQGVVSNAGNWISVTLDPAPAAVGIAGNIYIDLNQLSAPWVRVKYVAGSSTGTLNGFITAKMV